ncbi:hypothetical protein GGF43_005964, partial [Coemansia sp. RSA 2618]
VNGLDGKGAARARGGREPGALDGAAIRAGCRGAGPEHARQVAAQHGREPRDRRRHCDDDVRGHDAGAAAAHDGNGGTRLRLATGAVKQRVREVVEQPRAARAERAAARRGGRGRRVRGAALCVDAHAVPAAKVQRSGGCVDSSWRRAVCVWLLGAAAVVGGRRVPAKRTRRRGPHVAQVQCADDAAVAAAAGLVSGAGWVAGHSQL